MALHVNVAAAGNTGACIGDAILATDWSVVVRTDTVWIPVVSVVITSVHRFPSAAPVVNDGDTSASGVTLVAIGYLVSSTDRFEGWSALAPFNCGVILFCSTRTSVYHVHLTALGFAFVAVSPSVRSAHGVIVQSAHARRFVGDLFLAPSLVINLNAAALGIAFVAVSLPVFSAHWVVDSRANARRWFCRRFSRSSSFSSGSFSRSKFCSF